MPAEAAIKQGDIATLRVATGPYRRYQGRQGRVARITPCDHMDLADLEFQEPGSDDFTVVLADVPLPYLEPVKDAKLPRRSPLNLAMPKDDRSEREKQAEAVTWLASHGYIVLEVGQFRTQAVCHTCSRRQGRTVKVFCRDCGSPVFGAHTGSTVGTPDLFISHPDRWARWQWLALEMKQDEKSERKPEQVKLADAGRITFCWSLRMVIDAVNDFEMRDARICPHPAVEEWLTAHPERQEAA